MQIDGETMETVTEFLFLGSKITAHGNWSQEIKRHFLLGRKAVTNLNRILKSRDITLPTKVHQLKAKVFPRHVWVWELDIKNSECGKIDAFELWCWRRLLRVPWTARRSNQSILKEISPEYSLEGLMLKLKLPPHAKSWLIGKDLDAEKDCRGGEGEDRGWDHWLDGHEFEWTPGVGEGQGSLVCCSPWGRKELDTIEWLNWTELILFTFST